MRPVLPGDLDQAVRVLLACPVAHWPDTMNGLLNDADRADRYRERMGRAHPRHGNGSLFTAAQDRARAPLPAFCDPLYCDALSAVLSGLRKWRKERRA